MELKYCVGLKLWVCSVSMISKNIFFLKKKIIKWQLFKPNDLIFSCQELPIHSLWLLVYGGNQHIWVSRTQSLRAVKYCNTKFQNEERTGSPLQAFFFFFLGLHWGIFFKRIFLLYMFSPKLNSTSPAYGHDRRYRLNIVRCSELALGSEQTWHGTRGR